MISPRMAIPYRGLGELDQESYPYAIEIRSRRTMRILGAQTGIHVS